MAPRKRTPLLDRFARFVQRTDDLFGCWLWTGSLRNGYGQINDGTRRTIYAHRIVWEQTYGPIPPGRCICHHCDERRCCRPDHLFLGTRADNIADMVRKQRHPHGATHYRVVRKRLEQAE